VTTDWSAIDAAISSATGQTFQQSEHTASSGGCISQTGRITGRDGRHFFIKLNTANRYAMFIAEASALDSIATSRTLRVPRLIAHGITGTHSYLVLEYLKLASHGNARLLGERLAAMHRCTSDRFGFAQDNYIGTSLQPNRWTDDWVTFWREQRLEFQLHLADQNGYRGKLQDLGAALMDALPDFFEGYTPQASLLHGDLWSGNHAYLPDGIPASYDPAAYYGDRECDLAMTELFGGYPAEFYAAYRSSYPIDAGYEKRRDLYNLYHILNHANLFGGGYIRQAEQMMQKLLAR
jgi:protein-ribulosamine 3-kinase